jgi:hypothetical protein
LIGLFNAAFAIVAKAATATTATYAMGKKNRP